MIGSAPGIPPRQDLGYAASPEATVTPLIVLLACADPIELPADPTARGAPVGVRTYVVDDTTWDVWYPTVDGADDSDTVSFADLIPASFVEAVGELPLPSITMPATRDAPMRRVPDPLPVVLFSHGFGGYRYQSFDLTTHLASRGYVVIAPDHVGRQLGDLVPCLLTSTLEDCNLALGFDPDAPDPAVDDLQAALDWISADGELSDQVDIEQVGVFGHSAGGGSTTGIANLDDRIDAALAMAGAGSFERSLPSAVIGGSCDGVVPEAGEGGLAAIGATAAEGYWSLLGGGHMAFADICDAGLESIADTLAAREDANDFFLTSMLSLATDGCPGHAPPAELACGEAYLPLETSAPLLRAAVTLFFDQHLRGAGDGLGSVDAAELVTLP